MKQKYKSSNSYIIALKCKIPAIIYNRNFCLTFNSIQLSLYLWISITVLFLVCNVLSFSSIVELILDIHILYLFTSRISKEILVLVVRNIRICFSYWCICVYIYRTARLVQDVIVIMWPEQNSRIVFPPVVVVVSVSSVDFIYTIIMVFWRFVQINSIFPFSLWVSLIIFHIQVRKVACIEGRIIVGDIVWHCFYRRTRIPRRLSSGCAD